MKLVVLYQPNSEHARKVEEFVHDFVRVEPSRQIELIDAESPLGVTKCVLYDLMQYPSVIAVDNDGALLRSWSGELPLMDELSAYAQPA